MENYILEFENYLNGLNEELKANDAAKELYYGFYVFDGPKIQNPDILFIGINPGAGDESRNFKVNIEEGSRISYLDVFNTNKEDQYPYPLAEQTIALLELAGKSEKEIKETLTKRAVKMNMYAIITNNVNDIEKCVKLLGKEKWGEFYNRCMKFVFDVIKDIQPKLVILEGKGVYDNMVEVCMEIKNAWDKNTGIGSVKDEELNTQFISYARNYSNIISDKEVLAKKIASLV